MLELRRKVSLAQALGNTRLLYNAGIWLELPAKLLAKLNGAYTKQFRRITKLYSDLDGHTFPDRTVADVAGVPTIEPMLVA